MNPGRDDLVAAHERIASLERELKEKDGLVEKMKKRQAPREPSQWPNRFRSLYYQLKSGLWRLVKVSLLISIIGAVLFGFVYLVEPNDLYKTSGIITELSNTSTTTTYSECKINTDPNGKVVGTYDCVKKERTTADPSKVVYKLTYTDLRGRNHTVSTTGAAYTDINNNTSRHVNKLPDKLKAHIKETGRLIYTGGAIPYISCKIRVYYLAGRWLKNFHKIKFMSWFHDISRFNPVFDLSMCRSPKPKKEE